MGFYPLVFFQKKLVPFANANVSIATNALQYGTGYFGGVRGYYNNTTQTFHIFRLNDHMQRFVDSAQLIGVELEYTKDELIHIFHEFVEAIKPVKNTYFRPFAYASSLHLAPNLLSDPVFTFALFAQELNDYLPTDRGLSVTVSPYERITKNCIPPMGKISGGYINSALAVADAKKRGFDDAIFLNRNGNVAEGSAMNIFIVKDNTLITPPLTEDILYGITRRTLLELARDLGISAKERVVKKEELFTADEVFFCGTGAQVAWVQRIDNKEISASIGPITKNLKEAFLAIVYGNNPRYNSWLTSFTVKKP